MQRYYMFKYTRESTGSVLFYMEKAEECNWDRLREINPGDGWVWCCWKFGRAQIPPGDEWLWHGCDIEGAQTERELIDQPWPVEIRMPDLW